MSHYETLGVQKDAGPEEIKRAYRRESRKNHPDREGGDHERMAAINRAMEVLGDPEKRARYDEYGDDDSGRPSIEVRAQAAILQVFMQIVERVNSYTNAIEVVQAQLREDKKQIPSIIGSGKNRIEVLERQLKRLKYKGKGTKRNFIADGVGLQIASIRKAIQELQENVKVADCAIELLSEFEWTTDETPPMRRSADLKPEQVREIMQGMIARAFGLSADLLNPEQPSPSEAKT